jgi:spore germination protein YaaH
MLVALAGSICLAACAPNAVTTNTRGPVGIISISDGGGELSDGAQDVPTTLDLKITAGRALFTDEVSVTLDGRNIATAASGQAVVASSSAQSLGSEHSLNIEVAGQSFNYRVFIVAPTQAMAAVHADGNQTDLDLDFSAPPDQTAVVAAAKGLTLTWLDDTRARATWSGAGPSGLLLKSTLRTARGAHLAADLNVALSTPPPGTLRRVVVPAPPAAHPKLLGFSVGTDASRASLAAHAGNLAVASPTGWRLGSDGSLSGAPDAAEVASAQSAGVRLWPLVQTNASDTAATQALLSSSPSANTFAAAAVSAAKSSGFDGIQLDAEGIPATNRDAFTHFVNTVAARLHASGVKLIVDVVPHKPGSVNQYSAGYDIPALAKAADDIIFLTYDEHTGDSEAGPVAGYDWDQTMIAGSATGIDASKVWLGVPLYARTWQDTSVTSISYAATLAAALSAPGAVVSEDFAAHTPYVVFQPPGESISTAYFDDAISLQWKESLAVGHGFAGVAAWRLGFEDPAWWNAN